MNLRRRQGAPRSRHRGIGVIAAIAILVVLAGLAAFIVSVVGLRSQSTALDVLGTRAFQSARTGIEWGMYQIQNPEETAGARSLLCTAGGGVIGTLNSGNGLGGTLSDFTVTVNCQVFNTYSEAGNSIWVYKIVAVACNIPSGGACPNNATTSVSYAERQLTALTETCRTPTNAPCS